MTKSRLLTYLLALFCMLAPFALPAEVDKKLRINIATEPETLDPSLMQGIPESKIAQGLMEGLVRLDTELNAYPAVATEWSHNPEQTVWTFKLRKDAKWQNGEPVTAKDFVYGIQRILTPSTAGPYAANVYTFIKGGRAYYEAGGMDKGLTLASVKAVDDYTIEYTLENPTPFFLTLISHASWLPLNKAAIDKGGKTWANSPETFVGNGPFKMVSYRAQDRIVMKKADTYWDKASIFWDEVDLFMIEDQNTENSAFVTGDIDVTESVQLSEVDNWKGKPEFRPFPMVGTYYVGFNMQRAPFDDVRVRKAFNMAIRRNLITDRVTRRGEIPATGLVPNAVKSAVPGKTFRERAGDLYGKPDAEGAKKLLAEAGYGPDKKLRETEYIYNTKNEHTLIGEQLQSMWKRALGVDVKLQNVEWGVKLKRTQTGDYDIGRLAWIGDYSDPMTFLELFTSDNVQNDPQLRSKKYDELIASARKEADPVKREDILIAAEKLLCVDECAVAPLYFYTDPLLIKADIQGLDRNPVGQLLYTRAKRVEAN